CRYDHVRPKKDAEVSVANGSVSASKPSSIPKPVKLPKPGLNADAAEFIPSWKRSAPGLSYAAAAGAIESEGAMLPLCPYFEECLKQHELAMEQAFAEAKSIGKCCGICMENIMEKRVLFLLFSNVGVSSCSYGTACRYDHVRPKKDSEVPVANGSVSASKPSSIPKPVKLPKPGLNANAAEFIPSWKRSAPGLSYAAAAGAIESEGAMLPLCPYFEECLKQHELAMEQAFAEAKSIGKCCGICMENIMEKALRFGILEGCRHCFCLDCIREWRRNQTFETDVVRSCPECRQHSNFVIPSTLWVEDDEEKRILCEVYRNNMSQKQCKYYKEGVSAEGCPFGNKCFYKHQLPDGSIDPGEEPHARRKPYLADFIFDRTRTDSNEDEALDEITADLLDNDSYLRNFFMRLHLERQ
ncbi:zinc finger, C3HC4 type, partial [Teladorsagia circumcincta]